MLDLAKPPVEPAILRVADLLLALHDQREVGGVLAAVISAAARLGAPVGLAYLPYDTGAAAWHLTSLLSPDAVPVNLDELALPLGPITLDPAAHAEAGAVLTLPEVFGSAWGADACRRIEHAYGIRGVIVRASGPKPATSTKIAALLNDSAAAPLIRRLMEHATFTLARFAPDGAGQPDRVLTPDSILRHVQQEVARAGRYQRRLSVVYVEVRSAEEATRVGQLIGRQLRPWDAVGRVEGDSAALLVVLPETSELEALHVVKQTADRLGGARPGVAGFPDRGTTPERLIEAARARSAPDRTAQRSPTGETWIREGSTALTWGGRLPDQVRCPGCSALYLHPRGGGGTPTELRDQRDAASEALASTCPDHPEQIVA
jgi:hypothetical protein